MKNTSLAILTCSFLMLSCLSPSWRATASELTSEASRVEHEPSFLVGGDISALPVLEKAGAVYRMDGQPMDCVEILSRCGWNCFRLRIFVNPTGKNVVVQDIPFTIALAKRIKATGAKLLLDFHYSDTWADPAHQKKPKAWEKLDFAELEKAVYEHSRDCIAKMKDAGVLPDMVQIGNEIDPGILWPEGKLWGVGDPKQQWIQLGRLLKAGERGVRHGAGQERIAVVIHVSCGGDAKKAKHFFENIEAQGVAYDIIGLSFYQWWHGSLGDLRNNLESVSATFDKEIFVVETAHPYRPTKWYDKHSNQDNMAFPSSVDGQVQYFQKLLETIRGVPTARVIGVQLWYPESIKVDGVHAWFGGAMAVFDEDGNLLPAAKLLGESSH
jgi:arabinogalactan endo-1,4-beta-galactosidase